MNAVLAFCWSEWRSQRALLLGYCALVFPSLMLGFAMLGDTFWHQEGGAHALGWFVAAGAIGVVAFAAPQLVRGEFATGSDRFVRRLPGALAPSFLGKLLFLLLALVALPLLGLAIGEVYLVAMGRSWAELFTVWPDASVHVRWPEAAVYGAFALLLVPWVWALGTWLPQGRMALGGAILFALCVGLAAWATVRGCPNLGETLRWRGWLWWLSPLGLAVAAASWIRGRRGGGAPRSAAVGACVAAVGLAPPAVWLGGLVHDYHAPDLQRLERIDVLGLSPDARSLLVRGAADENWYGVPIRIDLASGGAEQLADLWTWCGPEVQRPYLQSALPRQRYWRLVDTDDDVNELFDLDTGERVTVEFDRVRNEPVLRSPWRERVGEDRCAHSPFRLPGRRCAWFAGMQLCVELEGGAVTTLDWPEEHRMAGLRPAGHGIVCYGNNTVALFDLAAQRFVQPSHARDPRGAYWCSRGIWFGSNTPFSSWQRRDPSTGAWSTVPTLDKTSILTMLDDDTLLCSRRTKKEPARLFAFDVPTGTTVEIALPDDARSAGGWSALESRDESGFVWLQSSYLGVDETILAIAIDPGTRTAHTRLRGSYRIVAFPPGAVLALEQHRRIVRIDLATGERTVLFPRSARDG